MHVDMDAFFASVEELANPSLRGKALVVAGPGERSVITTASYPARKYGIRTGMTVRQAKALWRNIVIVHSDHRKYTDASKKVMVVLESITPDIDITSIDEAFLDVSSVMRTGDTPRSLGMEVGRRVREDTGLTCSVGIAQNRLMAKLASDMRKPDGLTVLEPWEIKPLLEKTPVGKLCGIGPVTTKALNEMGLKTCGQLGRYPVDLLKSHFGSYGSRLSEMGRGEDVQYDGYGRETNPAVKSIGHSVTFSRDLVDRHSMCKVLQTLAEMLGRRARRHQCGGKNLTLTWRYNDFSTRTRSTTLSATICRTEEIYRSAILLLKKIELEKPVRLLGISLSHLSFEPQTGSLLPEDIRKEEIQKTLDGINDRFGEFTLSYGDTIVDLRTQKVIPPSWRPKGVKNSV